MYVSGPGAPRATLTCRLSSVALLSRVCVSQLQLHPRSFVFLLKAFILPVLYMEVCWCCYLPRASKKLLRTGLRMAPETSVCARGVGEIQEVYLSSPSQQCAENCSSLLPPAGSCPRALPSLLVLEPCPRANTLLQGSEMSSSGGEELQEPGDHDDEVRYRSAVPCPGSCHGVPSLEVANSC